MLDKTMREIFTVTMLFSLLPVLLTMTVIEKGRKRSARMLRAVADRMDV